MREAVAWCLLAAASAVDVATTWAALGQGAQEANPVMAASLHAWGVWGLVLPKVVVLGAAGALLAHERRRPGRRRWILAATSYGAVVTWGVAAWNLLQLHAHAGLFGGAP